MTTEQEAAIVMICDMVFCPLWSDIEVGCVGGKSPDACGRGLLEDEDEVGDD